MVKGLVFAGNRRVYDVFLQEHNLNPREYKYAFRDSDLQGYHRDANPKLCIILLDRWWDSQAYKSSAYQELRIEFRDRIFLPDATDIALALLKVECADSPAELPEFLSSEDESIRETAKKKLLELNGQVVPEPVGSEHFTKSIRGSRGGAQIIGPPQRITRAVPGSAGKTLYVDVVRSRGKAIQDARNWLDDLDSSYTGSETGFGKWSGIQTKLDAISDTESPEVLPQYLVDEHDVVRDAAKEKLEKLGKLSSKETE